jgi:tRNA(Arg) A34 adenosine deaminase TadA
VFQEKVEAKIRLMESRPLREIEAELARKRAAWAAERLGAPAAVDAFPATPRGAAELFLYEFLGIPEAESPIVSESEREVVWRSSNACDTLEACRASGRDTREVCRALYEKPVQWLISRLDPQLRFLRSYDRIRPHQADCEERIVRADFDAYIRRAIEEARQSLAEGNKGYGAVVAFGDEVIAQAHDTAATEGDPSLHAEVNALRAAARRLGDRNLSGCLLLSSCEPCPMCASLAVWSNVTTVVFGASIADTAALGKARIEVPAQELVDRSPATIEVIGGWLQEECLALYR